MTRAAVTRAAVLFAVALGVLAAPAQATTLVLLISEHAAVIASDSLAHGSHRGVISDTRRKVSRPAKHLLVGTAGVAALADESGVVTVDLHARVAERAAAYTWRDPQADAQALGVFLRAELARLEAVDIPGSPDRFVNPTVSVMVAGRARSRRLFAVQLTVPGALTPRGATHRAVFGPVRIAAVRVRPVAVTAEIVSRLPEVVDRAAEELTRPSGMLPAIARLVDPRTPLTARSLTPAAREVVELTMRLDPEIGGAVQIEALER